MTFIVFTSIPRPFPVINPTIPHLLFFTFDRKGPYYQNNRSVRDLIEDEGDAP